MSDKHYVGLDLTGFEDNGKTRPISRVTLSVDENNVITAGDDTGMELTADCPHATQDMADAILARIKGYRYQMFTADAANIDPAAELGDGVTAGGVYGVLSRLNDDGGGFPNIEAPGEAELEDEYPTGGGPMTKVFNRKLAYTRSLIEKSAEEIRLAIEAADGRISELKVTLDGVTIRDESGQTRIKGSSIETGSIAAGSIRADQIQLSGAITWGDLDSGVQGNINNRGISESRAQTLINSTLVSSPNIAGATFWNYEQDRRLIMSSTNDSYGVFKLCTERNNEVYFSIFEDVGAIGLMTYGNVFLHVETNNTSSPQGTWDFSDATVKGITAVFA